MILRDIIDYRLMKVNEFFFFNNYYRFEANGQ